VLLPLTMLMWSGNIIAGRIASGQVPPMTLSFWRWVIASLVILPFAWRSLKADRAVLLQSWPILVVLSVFGVAGFNTFSYLGLEQTTAVNAALLQSATSPLVFLLAFALFRERATPMQLVGVAVSIAGVVLIVARGSLEVFSHLRLNPGDGFVLCAVATGAIYAVLLRKRPPVHPLSLLAAIFSLGAVIMIPFYAAELMAGRTARWGPEAGLTLAYVSIFPSVIAYLFYNRGVQLLGAGRAGQFGHLTPLLATLLAVGLLGERLHGYHLAGAVLIAGGIYIASRRGAQAA